MAGVAALLLVASGARADDTHYRSVPIGAHAIALGGAFAGVADDASAAFYNPAGLALGGTHGLAGGLTINAWDRFEFDQALENPDDQADATDKSGRTVPIFIGAALKFGPKDALEQKRYTLALSVVEPNFSKEGYSIELEADLVELTDTYTYRDNDRGTWYGVSFASRIDLKQSIGASMYLSVRSLSHSEVGLSLGGGAPSPSDPNALVGTSSAANNQSLGFRSYHFVFRFGWLYRMTPQLQLGVMLQPPGIPLKQRVNVTSQAFVNDNRDPSTPVMTEAYFFDEKVHAHLPIPLELKGGLEYWAAEKVMLALDAAFYSGVRSGQRAEVSESLPIGGMLFDNDTARRPIANVALGGDFYISKKVMIETGFFTDFSSAINIPANPDRYYNPQINRYAGTLSLGLNIAGVSLAVGSTFLYGKGAATGAVVDADNLAIGYTRTEASSRTVFLHLTGATQAATDLGGKTAKGVKTRRAKKEKEADEPESQSQETDEADGDGESPATD
jgi:long-subunit fatty acid transport protein